MLRITPFALITLLAAPAGPGDDSDYKAYGQTWQTVEDSPLI